MSNSGDQGHSWKRLKLFAELLGPNFDHEDESRLLAAFQDFVYFTNFGWEDLESLVQGRLESDKEFQSIPVHESSFECDDNDIYVEDILNICLKVKAEVVADIRRKRDRYQPREILVESALFIQSEAPEEWTQHVVGRGCFGIPDLGFNSRHIRITTIPGLMPSSSPRFLDTGICDEHLISIAKRAACFSLHHDCYDLLRRIARNYVSETLLTAFKGNPRDLLMAQDFQKAIISVSRHVVCGYGYKGFKRAFHDEILKVLRRLYRNAQIDFSAVEVVNDLICHLFDKLLQATPRASASQAVHAVPVQLDGGHIRNPTLWAHGPAMIVCTKSCSSVKSHLCILRQLITLESIQTGLDKIMGGELHENAYAEGQRSLESYSHANWEVGHLSNFCQSFSPEMVATLAFEWYDVHFEDAALLFATAVLDYICEEIIEQSKVANDKNHAHGVICPRDILHVLEYDEELRHLFKGCFLKDAGSASVSWRKPLAEMGLSQERNNDMKGSDYHEFLSKEFLKGDGRFKLMEDAFTGFSLLPGGNPCQIDLLSFVAKGISRRRERNRAILNSRSNPAVWELLIKEIPLDASPQSLECLDFDKLRRTIRITEQFMGAYTCSDIPRFVLKAIINSVCLDPEFADHKVWKFTHEAVNALHLGLERYLLDVLSDACGKVVSRGLAIVEPSHITDAVRSHRLVMAAAVQDRARISQLLEEGVCIDSMFKCDSAVMVACDNDDAALMELLIEHNANVNMKHETPLIFGEKRPNCVLLRAVQEGRINVLRLLLHRFSDRVDFTVHTGKQQNVLMQYVQTKGADADIIERFLSQRAIHINAKDGEGRTAFQLACHGECVTAEKLILLGAEVEREFIEKLKVDPIHKNRLLAALDVVATPGLK